MEFAAHLHTLRAEGAALGSVSPAELGNRVPSCPDWDVAGLLGHTSWVHRWVTAILAAPAGERVSARDVPQTPTGDAVIGWYADGLTALSDAFDVADPDAPRHTFIGPRNTRWWARRLTHENAVHRWDREAATGTPRPIAVDVALDGVDETISTHLQHRFDRAAFGAAGQTLHLHAGDGDGEWTVTFDADEVRCVRGHAKGDVAVRAPASDLLLWVMGRVPTDAVEVFGDVDLARRFRDVASI